MTDEETMTPKTFLVFGATGQTGRHFVRLALDAGHRVRAVARDPGKQGFAHPRLEVFAGTVPDVENLDELLDGVDAVVSMLGDARLQQDRAINTEFVRRLVPAMRRRGVSRFLYQAGGLSKPPGGRLSLPLLAIRNTLARGYDGQHRDNEGVMEYLTQDAPDLEWMVHRAGIGSDGPSKGELHRSSKAISIATFGDCAAFSLRTVLDDAAVRQIFLSSYRAS